MRKRSLLNFFHLFRSFSSPLASVTLMILGSSFYNTFLSVLLQNKGCSREKIGLIHSAFFLGMFLGAFQMEKLIKKIGHIQALAVFGSLATSSILVQSICQDFSVWLFLRFLLGLSLAALYIVIESWMLYKSTVKTRGTILSLYMLCLYSSQSASQQFLAFVDVNSYTPFVIAAIFTSLSVIPVGLSTSRIKLPPTHQSIKFLQIIKTSPFGVTGCFVAGLVLGAIYSFFPVFAIAKNIPSENLMSITIAGGVFLQWPIGKLSDIFERRRILLITVLISIALSLTMFAYRDAPISSILIFSFIIGGLLFTLYPLSITQVCDHIDHSHITTATALLLIAYGFGSVLGPIISSFVIGFIGINAIFLYFVVVLGVLGILGIYATIKRPIVPIEEQTEFQSMPNVTPVAAEMDPRGDSEDD